MTKDALTVLNDVPFSIPPYFALIARAVVTLEGVALIGNPDYGLIMEAYPFVARKLLRLKPPHPLTHCRSAAVPVRGASCLAPAARVRTRPSRRLVPLPVTLRASVTFLWQWP